MSKINTTIQLDDIGLFRKRQRNESMSQRERAEQIRDEFQRCMDRALFHNDCCMPYLCAHGCDSLGCAHLIVDYTNFTGKGIPLPMRARTKFDARLRAIGTLIYRQQSGMAQQSFLGSPLPGDIHIPSLQQIKHFTGGPRKSTPKPKAKPRAAPAKRPGFLSRLFG